MNRRIATIGGLIVVSSGCSILPASLLPPTVKTVLVKPASFDISIKTSVNDGQNDERKVMFNLPQVGVAGNNDVAHLVVGLFDDGTTTAPGFGYAFIGNAGTTPSATTMASTASPYTTSPAYIADLAQYRLGTLGTSTSNSGYGITTDNKNVRRFMVRDYLDGTNWTTATMTKFSNLPLPNAAGVASPSAPTGAHVYIVFAAAYDNSSPPNWLGYAEQAVTTTGVNATAANAEPQLVLNLSAGLVALPNGALTEVPSISSFVPYAN